MDERAIPDCLIARVERDSEAVVRIVSPAVGIWCDGPRRGALLVGGDRVGTLKRLEGRVAVVLPPGISGRVEGASEDRAFGVEYGETLFVLAPIQSLGVADGTASHGPGVREGGDLPPGTLACLAPTDGVFYRRPAADAAPFVEVGQRIRHGAPVGLVEVMKTFHLIVYGEPGLPAVVDVLEIRAGDGEEVRARQPLVVVRGIEAGGAAESGEGSASLGSSE